MNMNSSIIFFLFILSSTSFYSVKAQEAGIEKTLTAAYHLGGDHSRTPQSFIMRSQLIQLGPDGKRIDSTLYTLYINCTPGVSVNDGDEYTCTRFTIRINASPEVSIPSLANWKYLYKTTADNKDEKGQVLGIDHSKFENIVDSNGQKLSIKDVYHTYNAFIDFHSLFVFSEPVPGGKGVQDLHYIGDKIIHAAAFSEPPVNLGKEIKEGSKFRNGEITLEFKGLGMMNKKPCAILGYDSGSSSFTMLMQYTPTMDINTNGSSHYWGDIYKDLQSGWIQQATLHEIVVSETVIGANKVNGVIERSIMIHNLNR
jgi:hypothetical protein